MSSREAVGVVRLVVEHQHPTGWREIRRARGGRRPRRIRGRAGRPIASGPPSVRAGASSLPGRGTGPARPEYWGGMRSNSAKTDSGCLGSRPPAPTRRSRTVMFGADHQDLVAEPGILAVGDLVESAPGRDERHHERLADPGGHLYGPAGVGLTRRRHCDPHFAVAGRLGRGRRPSRRLPAGRRRAGCC